MLRQRWGEYADTIIDLVDAHEAYDTDHRWFKAKLADLEDSSRRNNIKI